MSVLWQPAEHVFPLDGLDEFLVWAWRHKASDVSFQTQSPAMIEVDGVLRRATGAILDGTAMGVIVEALFGPTGDGTLRAGAAIDCSHTVWVEGERSRDIRFRCNFSPVQVEHGFGINATLRILPGKPPALDEYGIEPEIAGAFEDPFGLTLVTGVPGSGKSTLLAAGTRKMLEDGVGRIQSYEAPIEFVFDGVGGGGGMMSSSEIPRHFVDFAEGLRSSLRRRPAAVIVGEARDRETIEAALNAADFGIAVFSTTHTVGVAATIRRMLSAFRQEERDERAAALVDLLNLVVTQVLVPAPKGGRTGVREWLGFDRGLKETLHRSPREGWPALIAAELERRGTGLVARAELAAAEGRLGGRELARIRASRLGGGVGS